VAMATEKEKTRVETRVVEVVAPVAELNEVIGKIAVETGESPDQVSLALHAKIASGNLILTKGLRVYNPSQPPLPKIDINEYY
jgi:hypothetical protein